VHNYGDDDDGGKMTTIVGAEEEKKIKNSIKKKSQIVNIRQKISVVKEFGETRKIILKN
jgi:hypothetical protein